MWPRLLELMHLSGVLQQSAVLGGLKLVPLLQNGSMVGVSVVLVCGFLVPWFCAIQGPTQRQKAVPTSDSQFRIPVYGGDDPTSSLWSLVSSVLSMSSTICWTNGAVMNISTCALCVVHLCFLVCLLAG